MKDRLKAIQYVLIYKDQNNLIITSVDQKLQSSIENVPNTQIVLKISN